MNLSFRSIGRYVGGVVLLWVCVTNVIAESSPIMPISQVRIGMKGYGRTVFQGTQIESFPVEVVSIISDSSPKRGTIWVRCPSDRMQKSGPVQGMSGSPIYLWDEGETGTVGEGGRMIGAFAFGYRLSKDCIVGVQPIELMRDIAQRKDEPRAADTRSWTSARRTFANLAQIADQNNTQPIHRFRFDILRSIIDDSTASVPMTPIADDARSARPLLLPMSVGSRELARVLSPLFEPMGLSSVAGNTLAGPPPFGTDVEGTTLEPGSVLSVPLVFGDLDMAALGTVTDVLDDGTVIGFGHPMFSQGAVALPMATGYVHFVVPSIDTSFKQGGSLRMVGSLVRDEETGVLGVPEKKYDTATINVGVTLANGDHETYQYELVNYRPLTGRLAATVMVRSLTDRHGLPLENTLDLQATIRFEDEQTFEINSTLPGGDSFGPLFEVLPIVEMMANNPFNSLTLKSMDVELTVREGVESATIVAGQLDHTEVAPGATVRVAVDVQAFNGDIETLHTQLEIPTDMTEGDYQITISGADAFAPMLMMTRAHRFQISNVEQLAEMVRDTLKIEGKALYLSLPRQDRGIAVGRTELANLPSSRTAILASPTHTHVMPFGELVYQQLDTEVTILGQLNFQLSVREGAYGTERD